MDMMVPRMKPVAADTWEIRARLPAASEESARIPLELPGPGTIIGVHVTVIQTTNAGGRLLPTVDNILLQLDLDFKETFTSSEDDGQTTPAGRGAEYVTLSALDTEFRDLCIEATSSRPDIGVTFRWRNFNAALYEDAEIGIAFFVKTK